MRKFIFLFLPLSLFSCASHKTEKTRNTSHEKNPLLETSSFHDGFESLLFNDGDTEKSVREEAKTTYQLTPKLSFKTVKDFRNYLNNNNASDEVMRTIKISKKSPRIQQESLFVTIEKAYLYIFKIEEDNDIHIIFGDNSSVVDSTASMNAEISALPVKFTKDEKQIKSIRKKAITLLKNYKKCNKTNEEPLFIPIKISGSVFYDSGHKTKHARCGCCATSNTAWEIHPIYDLQLLEN